MIKIYKLTIRGNGKSLIGKTSKSLGDRLRIYWQDAQRFAQRGNNIMYKDMVLYGKRNITITLIEECIEDVANNRIEYWIEYFNTREPFGYNTVRQPVIK